MTLAELAELEPLVRRYGQSDEHVCLPGRLLLRLWLAAKQSAIPPQPAGRVQGDGHG